MSVENNIPNGWVETTLGEVATFLYGKMPLKSKIQREGFPIYSGYRNSGFYPEMNCKRGALIVVARGVGGTGDVKLCKDDCFLTNLSILINTSVEKVRKDYLYYSYQKRNLRYLDSGSAQSQITIGDLSRVILHLPPLSEQTAIAKILTAFDDKIELLQAQNKTLETTAQTIFKEWFGKYQIGDELPDGWHHTELGDIAFNYSKSFKFSDKNVVFINTGDVSKGQFLHSNEIPPIGLPGQAKKAIELHDILYSEIRPKNKRFAFVDFETPNYVVSTKFMIIRPIDGFSPFILYFILKSKGNYSA